MSDATAVKLSPAKEASELRRKVFVERWLTNGNNATEACIYAGYSAKTAGVTSAQLMARDDVRALIGHRAARVLQTAVLSTERWAKEMAAIGHFDPGEMYDGDGQLIPLHKLPEHVRRAIGSVKTERRYEGKGEHRTEVVTQEVKPLDKNVALTNIGRHLGVFEKDNKQQITAIQVVVEIVG